MKRIVALILILLLTLPCFAFAQYVPLEYNSVRLSVTYTPNGSTTYMGNTVTLGSTVIITVDNGYGISFDDLTFSTGSSKVLEFLGPFGLHVEQQIAYRAQKTGTCTVTVKSTKDSSFKASVKITVVDPNKLKLTSFSFLDGSVTTRAKERSIIFDPGLIGQTLNSNPMRIEPVQIAKDCTITWKSSNPKVVKVGSDGTPIIMGPGKTKITATVTHAASKTKKTASYTITFVEPNVLHSAFFYEPTFSGAGPCKSAKIRISAGSMDLSSYLFIVPMTSSDKVQDYEITWKSSNKKVADFADPRNSVLTQ